MLVAVVSVMFLSGALGMLLTAAVAHPPTGPGYWRLVALLVFAAGAAGVGMRLSPFGALLPPLGAVTGLLTGLAAVALAVFVMRKGMRPERRDTPLLMLTGFAALGALISDPVLRAGNVNGAAAAVYAIGLGSAGLVLGCVVLAMILAHWYLIDPGMPIAPLNRVVAIFLGTEVLKLALLGAIVLIHAGEWTSADGGLLRAFVLGDALFVAVRAVLGILAPLGLAWMTWKTVQIRSIQSATGILYAAIVFVLFGELISLYLSLSTGTPF